MVGDPSDDLVWEGGERLLWAVLIVNTYQSEIGVYTPVTLV